MEEVGYPKFLKNYAHCWKSMSGEEDGSTLGAVDGFEQELLFILPVKQFDKQNRHRML